ncbi:MAG: hypothetical protein COC15_00060 [Legionellales bacterium]|nr:MAG: hypothetical protein COC15_00060 [Legionellales bacterium]
MASVYLKKLANSVEFHRKSYVGLLYLAALLATIILALSCTAIYRHLNIPAQEYFATTVDGKVIKLNPHSNS